MQRPQVWQDVASAREMPIGPDSSTFEVGGRLILSSCLCGPETQPLDQRKSSFGGGSALKRYGRTLQPHVASRRSPPGRGRRPPCFISSGDCLHVSRTPELDGVVGWSGGGGRQLACSGDIRESDEHYDADKRGPIHSARRRCLDDRRYHSGRARGRRRGVGRCVFHNNYNLYGGLYNNQAALDFIPRIWSEDMDSIGDGFYRNSEPTWQAGGHGLGPMRDLPSERSTSHVDTLAGHDHTQHHAVRPKE